MARLLTGDASVATKKKSKMKVPAVSDREVPPHSANNGSSRPKAPGPKVKSLKGKSVTIFSAATESRWSMARSQRAQDIIPLGSKPTGMSCKIFLPAAGLPLRNTCCAGYTEQRSPIFQSIERAPFAGGVRVRRDSEAPTRNAVRGRKVLSDQRN